jgi:hypothetical protein
VNHPWTEYPSDTRIRHLWTPLLCRDLPNAWADSPIFKKYR